MIFGAKIIYIIFAAEELEYLGGDQRRGLDESGYALQAPLPPGYSGLSYHGIFYF